MIISNKEYPILAIRQNWRNGKYNGNEESVFVFTYKHENHSLAEQTRVDLSHMHSIFHHGSVLVISNDIWNGIMDNNINMLDKRGWFRPHPKMVGKYIIITPHNSQLLYTCVIINNQYYFSFHVVVGNFVGGGCYIVTDSNGNEINTSFGTPTDESNNINIKDWSIIILELILFKCFAKIETVTLDKVTSATTINQKRYKNNTKSDVCIIDSTWYTTLIQTDGFGVKGHFGLRSCGKGRKDRKLVYINAYKKNGYTRTAKRLKEENK